MEIEVKTTKKIPTPDLITLQYNSEQSLTELVKAGEMLHDGEVYKVVAVDIVRGSMLVPNKSVVELRKVILL